MFLDDERTWREESNPYYKFYHQEEVCNMILGEFGLHSETSHIVNGHTPVKTMEGEQPIRANGKLMVIDGGFCKDYHEKTGIAGYTLIYNSHGVRIKALTPWWRSSFSGALHLSGALAGCFLSLCCPHGVHPEISIRNEAEFRFATALSARSASVVGHGDRKGRELCHGAVRTECICKSRQTLFVSCAVSW